MSNYRIEDRLKAMGYDPSTLEENDKIAIATNLNYLHDEYIEEIAENPWYVPGGVINIYDDKYVPVTSIIINGEIPKLNVGDTYTINATVKPDNASFKQLLYNSGDASIVTIDKKGKITSKAVGTTTITVISDDNEAITAETTVEVKIGVTSVTVSGAEIVKTGTPQQLSVTVEPEEATYKEVTWSSSNENVATVDNTGLVTAISEGNVTITATSTDNPSAKGTHNMTAEVSVTGVTVSGPELVKTGTPQQLSVTVEPEEATYKEVTWSSSNENVATVDNTGLVTAIAGGNVTITATSNDNPSAIGSHNMTSEVSVTSVDIQEESVEIIAGDTTQLHVTVSPEDATDKTVTWSSSDTSIATVDNTGLVTGVGDGEVTITVTSNDNTSLTDTCAITSKIDYSRNYFTTVVTTGGTVTWRGTSSNALSYSTDNGATWSIPNYNITLSVNVGDKVLWKGTTTPIDSGGIGKFKSDTNVRYSVEGNTMSLLFGDDFKGQTSLEGKNITFYELFKNNTNITSAENLSLPATTLAESCYYGMFNDCINLTTAPQLPATTLAESCYSNMFYGCTSLTTAPELPATTLVDYCYSNMFDGCTSLTTTPQLPATTLASYCYSGMFQGCTSLTTAPSVLPATTLVDYCYTAMFNGCTNLTTAPELPATTLAEGCYSSMFVGCTSLTTAPELPATTLADYCYETMFDGCTSLTTTPQLPATTLASYCYSGMFQGCTSLTTAPSVLPATTLADYCYDTMFDGCTSLTTTPQLPATTLAEGCYINMFYNCTSLTTVPSILPATTLTSSCYDGMFYGCTNLTTAPELPATTLTPNCYANMFNSCTSLNSITCLATNISATECTMNWVTNVAVNGTFTKDPSMEDWTTGVNGIPSSWTVVDAS